MRYQKKYHPRRQKGKGNAQTKLLSRDGDGTKQQVILNVKRKRKKRKGNGLILFCGDESRAKAWYIMRINSLIGLVQKRRPQKISGPVKRSRQGITSTHRYAHSPGRSPTQAHVDCPESVPTRSASPSGQP